MAAATKPAATKAAGQAREYVVLRETSGGWVTVDEDVGTVTATTDQQAIRKATDGTSAQDRTGVFVAVPTRSWRPRTRSVEVKEVDRWT